MSTHKGNNPVTGAARPELAQQAEADAKTAKIKAQEESKRHAAIDGAVKTALKSHEKTGSALALALANASDAEIHKHVTNPETGRPFTSFTAYLQARTSEFPLLHKTLRKALVAELVKHGASVRQIAAVTQTSVGTAAGDVNEANGQQRTPQTGGDGVQESATLKASKAVKGYSTACTRVNDALADMTDEEIATVISAGNETLNLARAARKFRAEAANKAKQATLSKAKQAVASGATSGKAAAVAPNTAKLVEQIASGS